MFARDSFWCIAQTLKQAGLQTHPYHVYVPSFGEWGFVLAGTHAYVPPTVVARRITFRQRRRPSRAFSISAGHGPAPHAR